MAKLRRRENGKVKKFDIDINFPDFPEVIKHAIEKTISKNLLQCMDPIRSKGNCLRISDQLMLNLSEAGIKPFVDCKIIHVKKPQPHFWVLVDGWHIDLTARQFNPEEPCPKIWKHDVVSSKSYYSLEKGKGLVVFKLVPLHPELKPVNYFRRMINYSINKKRAIVDLLGHSNRFNNQTTQKPFYKFGLRNWRIVISALLKRFSY